MKCVLGKFIYDEYIKAYARREHHEVMRREQEARDHDSTCPICSGIANFISDDDLASLLFPGKIVIVVEPA